MAITTNTVELTHGGRDDLIGIVDPDQSEIGLAKNSKNGNEQGQVLPADGAAST